MWVGVFFLITSRTRKKEGLIDLKALSNLFKSPILFDDNLSAKRFAGVNNLVKINASFKAANIDLFSFQ